MGTWKVVNVQKNQIQRKDELMMNNAGLGQRWIEENKIDSIVQ